MDDNPNKTIFFPSKIRLKGAKTFTTMYLSQIVHHRGKTKMSPLERKKNSVFFFKVRHWGVGKAWCTVTRPFKYNSAHYKDFHFKQLKIT
jgi:hypothetical protein